MGQSLLGELRSLLVYFGEDAQSPEAPDQFFNLIVTFSSSLQKCALEVHDAEVKLNPAVKKQPAIVEPNEDSGGNESTVKIVHDSSSQSLAPPQAGSQGRSIGRGDLDQAIRSMRDGKRRARPSRPLSKIFFDGGRPQSRMYE
ncbi:hypothetical protein C8R43DRAFT_308792 [Mycena crocata]|nr:hypothetical protein C8R43DRAFT_308792 [Mycena crocata]